MIRNIKDNEIHRFAYFENPGGGVSTLEKNDLWLFNEAFSIFVIRYEILSLDSVPRVFFFFFQSFICYNLKCNSMVISNFPVVQFSSVQVVDSNTFLRFSTTSAVNLRLIVLFYALFLLLQSTMIINNRNRLQLHELFIIRCTTNNTEIAILLIYNYNVCLTNNKKKKKKL